ncbi:DsbA family protein [Phenylobacterium sp. SCN 70-31]|uniref:2-hydroxychromene-2-carboxylate isomerase n=1 Tax=Phenylobacterium sp. SCN 70-31 TaxID=1660129 RepID=UPI000A588516|nr:DsbA family protein [Phenylobacterium sp. SCN 70-31]
MLTYDLYWSFRSPYSYFIAGRLRALEETFELQCNVRPIFPIAVRTPEFFESRDPLWFSYFMADIRREAEFLGLPLQWPRPDPVYRAPDGSYPKEQPHIHRLTYLGVAAAERGRGLPFLDEVSRLIWSGETTDWHEGDHLRLATERAGLDYGELMSAVEADPGRYRAIVEESQAAQRAGGHYGVPMMVFDGEPFFGQDRFDQLKWRMEQKGLKRRALP